MADWKKAFEFALSHEVRDIHGDGEYTNDPRDFGKATKWGISLRFLRSLGIELGDIDHDGDIDENDVLLLDRARIEKLYKLKFWDLYRYDRIKSPDIAAKIFDLCINMGPRKPTIFLQRALLKVGKFVHVDGVLGDKETIPAVNSLNKGEIYNVVAWICEFAAEYYKELALNPKHKWALKGWLNRAAFMGPTDKNYKWESEKISSIGS